MTETLVGMEPPSKKSLKTSLKEPPDLAGLAVDADAVPCPGPVGGLLARGPADAVPVAEQELELARELVRRARESGSALTGPGGLLKSITKLVIETALEEEMSEHLGYDKHAVEGRNRGNSRNGKRPKTVLTDAAGAVDIDVPRDRDGTFDPVIARLAAAATVRHRHGRAEPVEPGPDQRGDIRALRGGVRGERVQGHHHPDH
jgi:putative transposase